MKNISNKLSALIDYTIDRVNYNQPSYPFRTDVYEKTQLEIEMCLGQLPDWVQYDEL